MDENNFRKQENENSLISNKIVIGQEPSNYQTHDTLGELENSNCCTNSRSTNLTGSQNNENETWNINEMCEGLHCFEKARTKLQVCVGTFGKIKLSLCNNCANKFTHKEVVQ